VLLLAWDRVFKIEDAPGNKQYKPDDTQELFRELFNDVQNIHEELAEYINTPGWNRPAFYDNDDDDDDVDYTIAITPVLSTEEPDNSLSMGDEHLDTIPATESDEVLKSSVENLIPIPSESEGIPEHMCDVPLHDNSLPLDVLKDQFEDFSESNDELSLTDDDSFSIDNIDYVEASPPDSELVSSETKSPSTSLNSLLEETNTSDNSLPEFETFYFDVEEISSGSTTTHSDNSLPEYEVFHDDHDVVEDISPIKEPQVHNALPTHPNLQLNMKFQPSSKYLFAYVVWIFLPFLVYSVAPHYLLSLRNEDTIFDPGICNSHFSRPDISHRCGTFPRFKVLPESPMEIFSSTCSLMDK
nr:hypothetical protein [Tanacetum cinerariifolium]